MKNYIITTTKNVYGNDLIYPDCDTAKALAAIADRKTFNDFHIAMIKKLGYKVLDSLDVSVLGVDACLERENAKDTANQSE